MPVPLAPANLDRCDRKDIFRNLERLKSHRLIEFLYWCCRQASGPWGESVCVYDLLGRRNPPAHEFVYMREDRKAQEIYWTIMQMSMVYNLDLDAAALELVRWCQAL